MKKKGSDLVNISLHILGLLFCTVPPLVCTLAYFPLWREGGETVISGVAALLIVLSALPLYKVLRRVLSSSSVTAVWLILFFTFFALSKIADEMTVISFVGAVSNFLGSVIFKIARKRRGET